MKIKTTHDFLHISNRLKLLFPLDFGALPHRKKWMGQKKIHELIKLRKTFILVYTLLAKTVLFLMNVLR